MVKDIRTVSILVSLSGLLFLSSGYLFEFHLWAKLNQTATSSSMTNYGQSVSGIRHLVNSSQPKQPILEPASTNNLSDTPVTSFTASGLLNSEAELNPGLQQNPVENQPKLQVRPQLPEPALVNKAVVEKTLLTRAPFFIELDNELIIEFPGQYSNHQIRTAISRALTLSRPVISKDLISKESINTSHRPYYYKRVKNQYNKPIRYPAQAYRYADYLISNHTETLKEDDTEFTVVQIPLQKLTIPYEIESYHHWVKQYAEQFNLPVELVFAVMRTESYFNPTAVSKSNALGLMQIKPKAAGRDVYKYIDNKQGYPSETQLFNPQENIRIGVAYLGLLQNKYLRDITNPKSREMMMISAYNGGLSKALWLFGDTPEKAVNRINQLYPRNIYRKLRYDHQSAETRAYLDKVLRHKKYYGKLMQAAV